MKVGNDTKTFFRIGDGRLINELPRVQYTISLKINQVIDKLGMWSFVEMEFHLNSSMSLINCCCRQISIEMWLINFGNLMVKALLISNILCMQRLTWQL